MLRMVVCLGAALALAVAPAALAAPDPLPAGTNDFGGFRNIIPPGQNGHTNAAQAAAFVASDGALRPANSSDQLPLYRELLRASPGLAPDRIGEFFKTEGFGVAEEERALRYSPRDDVTIVRGRKFGVPSIYGTDRRGAIFGAGYIGAEDRLFLMDVLRHTGRAQLSSFIGGSESNRKMDAEQWQVAPYTEADLQKQYDQLDDLYGEDGKQVQEDITEYIAGINKYICETQALRPDCSAAQRVPVQGKNGLTPAEKLPGVYAAITPNGQLLNEGPQPRLFTETDLIAIASLIGSTVAEGGGGELGSALVLQRAIDKFGPADGPDVFGDFRSAEDPEAPTTVDKPFPYLVPPADPAEESDGRPDKDSLERAQTDVSSGGSGGDGGERGTTLGEMGLGGLDFPSGASNALLVSAAESESGRPVTVFGPQLGFFSPQILVELDMHAPAKGGRPAIDARGVALPGAGLYVQLGRGRDYAWSATSADQDIVDTFAVDLCEPDGSAPTKASDHYMYRGKCLPFEVLVRENTSVPNAADRTVPPSTQTLRTLRSKLGLVVGRALVDGRPTAYTQLRTTYMHEVDSALGFLDFNDPEKMENAEEFQRAASRMGFTFNWFYTDDRDIAYFNSGFNPVRNPKADPNFPVRACPTAACEFEWRNFDPERLISDRTPFSEHPQAINPPFLSSWNNKQAPEHRAADDNYSWQSVHRSESLDDRVRPLIEADGKSTLTELIDAVQDAATVDLRGSEVLPVALDVLGDQSGDPELAEAIKLLRGWAERGAHRRDMDGNGTYEDAAAVALMDAWWPRLVEAQFKETLGEELYNQILELIQIDDTPNNDGAHTGSAYIAGWYGYVDKDLRAVLADAAPKGRASREQRPKARAAQGQGRPAGAYSRRYCGDGDLAACRTALAGSLRAALAADDPAQLYNDDDPQEPGDQPLPSQCEGTGMSRQMCFDSIVFTAVGFVSQPAIAWQNRPTFQQVVEVQGHRDRGTPIAQAEPAPAPQRAAPSARAPQRRTASRDPVPRDRAAPRAATDDGGDLPFTGLAIGGIVLAGAALVTAGVALRRRLGSR